MDNPNTTTVTLRMNGAEAQKVLDDLKKNLDAAKQKLQDLQNQKASPKDIEKAKREVKKLQNAYDEARSSIEVVNDVMANLDKVSLSQLQKTLRTLNKQFKDAEQGTETFDELAEKIRMVKEQIAAVNEETRSQDSLSDRFFSWTSKIWAGVTLGRDLIEDSIAAMQEYVDAFAGMDQEMAGVRKYTGMTEEQVARLNEEFKKMDTRTSREQLNLLAQDAGRLGKQTVEDVLGFVRAADKINVALDDLGDGATLTLSKLSTTFGVEEQYGTEQSLLKVGSIINELSQNCSASAPYIAQFTERMAGVGAQANMTIPQIMGFAAVLDANSQRLESSATAVSQVLVHLYQEPAKYAKVAGIDVQKFTTMLKEDANGALVYFLETLQKAGGMDVLSPMFKDMGENGSGAIAALSTLAQNIEFVKAQQEAANIAFLEGSSIGDEFAVQNNTIAANLDKCRKSAHEIQVELGEQLYPLMSHLLSASSALMQAVLISTRFLLEHKTTIITLTVATGAYVAAMKLQALWLDRVAIKSELVRKKNELYAASTKALSGVITAGRLVVAALTNAYQYLANGFRVTTAMQERWKASMAAMNFVSWTSLILGVAAAVYMLYRRFTQTSEAQKSLDEIRKKAAGSIEEQRAKIQALEEAAKDENRAMDERIALTAKLNSIIPDYNAQIDETTGKYTASKEALDKYLESLTRMYEVEGAQDKLREIGKEKAEIKTKLNKAQSDYDRARQSQVSGEGRTYQSSFGMVGNTAQDNASLLKVEVTKHESDLKEVEKRERAILDVYETDIKEKLVNEILKTDTSPESSDGSNTDNPSTGNGYTSQTLTEKERKKREAEERRRQAKERKEFKEDLDNIKGARAEAETQAMADRSAGLIDYRQYLDRMREAEVKFYENSSKLYIDNDLEEDEDHKTLLKKKQEADDKYNIKRLALNKEVIERMAAMEEREEKFKYDGKLNKSMADELEYSEKLLTIRYNKLMDLQQLYQKGSQEWEQYEREIQDLLYKDQQEKQQTIIKKVQEFRERFDKLSVKERYQLEYDALEKLYEMKKISEEQYQEWLKKLREKERKEQEKELPGKKPETPKSKADDASREFERQKAELDRALDKGEISQEEYDVRLSRIKNSLFDNLIQPLKDAKSEWLSLMASMIDSWKDFADALQDPDGDPLGKLAGGIEATSALMGAVFSQMTAFMQAELQIQTSAVEKRYEKEVAAAEGNSYRVAKLEKEKEQELAKLKNDANRKMFAMQVIQAVAQTATNALNAYGSTVVIPVVGPTLAPIAAAVAAAQGAVQIALIKKQQQAAETQGYSKGGFTKKGRVDEPAGIVHAGEWVASQKLLASPVARPMIEALDYAQRTNTVGSLRQEDVSRSITAPQSMARIADGNPGAAVMAAAMASNSDVLQQLVDRLGEPMVSVVTVTGDKGINSKLDEYDTLMRNKSPKTKKKNANNR